MMKKSIGQDLIGYWFCRQVGLLIKLQVKWDGLFQSIEYIKNAERELKIELLKREIGGVKGGSKLTQEAKDLMEKYERFRNDAAEEIERIYEKYLA